MRIKNIVIDIDYDETKNFFERRMKKYKEDNPYSLTMYQDNHPELVRERNAKEVEIIRPLLKIQNSSKVLDIACGIGRWSDAIVDEIDQYCGLDYCESFIQLAKKRNEGLKNRSFFVAKGTEILKCINENALGKFNTILMMGFFMYLNDSDLLNVLNQVLEATEEESIICIREPIGISERLTLKDFYSNELEDEYNVIYRTRDELYSYFELSFLKKGFEIVREGFLFDDANLNNRKETSQYLFIFERKNNSFA